MIVLRADHDVVNKRIWYSEQWKKMIGFKDAELPNVMESWLDRVLPEDREAIMRQVCLPLVSLLLCLLVCVDLFSVGVKVCACVC